MIAFDLVNSNDVAAEIAKNADRHVLEKLDYDDLGRPDIDWDYYIEAGHSGFCKVVTMRDKGHLVGYAVFMINNNPRHKKRIEAFCEGLFIEKQYRGKLAINFLQKCHEFMKKIGIHEANFLICDEKIGRFLAMNGFMETKRLWSIKYE